MGSFVHLHVHSEYSILDGLGTVQDYVKRAKELGQPAIALTDHGVLCGAPSFYHAARQEGIEPIIGEEFYFVPDASWRPAKGEKAGERYHVVLLAKGRRGYQVLSELSTLSHRNFYYKPLLDRGAIESLGSDAQHLVCLSGCANSIISKKATEGSYEEAAGELVWWREQFPHFYIELQHHDTDFDRNLNNQLIKLAKRYTVPWVITNDPHYVVPEDYCHHDTLLAIQTASDVDDPARFRFDGHGYHLRSRQEMFRAFKQYGLDIWTPGAAETVKVARSCRTRIPAWDKRTWHIPSFPDVEDSFAELKRLTLAELKRRRLNHNIEYVKRVARELSVIEDVGIADFLLITRWFIQQAIERGIPVGPGRGSVCGTLVGYLIGLHKVDPIRYNLLFERFLNPARPRMPDIDTDFGQSRRMEMFDLAVEKFGAENVVLVAAYGKMKHKKAFQALGKVHGISYPDRVRISKDMPDKPGDDDDLLPEEIRKQYPDLAAALTRLNGVRSELKSHPAGVIIASPGYNLRKLVPEMWLASGKRMCGQYDLDAIEEMGLMKEDFLGLRTLDTIALTCAFIEERTGEKLDPDSWVPDNEDGDSDVWKMLAEGRTGGVFQMEGGTNTRGIVSIHPEGFEDVVSCTALYRTGPILAGYPDQFLHNRQVGKKRIRYTHPLLKRILARTWGVILYQEQVMEIGKVLAGFDDAGQDEIKEAIKHKKSTVMDELRPLFIKGCTETNQIPKAISTAIWKDIEGYAGYSYNRSHAVAYSLLTYQTAKLKCFWPTEFMAALMATIEDKERMEGYRRECLSMQIKLLPPDVNYSNQHARPEERGIRMGLMDFKGIGAAAANKVVDGRPEGGYTHEDEIAEAVRNAGSLGVLTKGGALKSIGIPGDIEVAEELLNWQFRDTMKRWRVRLRDDVDFPREDGDWCCIAGEITKMDRRKTKDDKPFMNWTVRWGPNNSWVVRLWSETESLWSLKKGSIVKVRGTWQSRWGNITVGNKRMIEVVKRAE